jgi:hypothetical protein
LPKLKPQGILQVKINYPIYTADPYTPVSKNPRAPEMSPFNIKVISQNHHSY